MSCGLETTPVPVSVTVEVAPVAELLTTVSLPVTAPAVVGAKVTGTASVCPAVSVLGSAVEAMENPVPLTDRELIVTEAAPEEVSVTDCDLVVPSVTLP